MTHPSGEPSYEIRKLYASAPPSPASVPEVDKAIVSKLAKRTCEANERAARLATPQPEPAWSPAYTRGPARQSAPVAAVPAMVPLTRDQMEKGRDQIFSINNPYCPCDSKTFRKVAEWVEAHHGVGLTVGK